MEGTQRDHKQIAVAQLQRVHEDIPVRRREDILVRRHGNIPNDLGKVDQGTTRSRGMAMRTESLEDLVLHWARL